MMDLATTIMYEIAKHVVTKDEVIAAGKLLIDDYTAQLLAQASAIRKASSPAPGVPTAVQHTKRIQIYEDMFANMIIHPEAGAKAMTVARDIISNRARYEAISKVTGVPWFFMGCLHSRESDCNFNTYLGNGQPLKQKTTITPKGRGPFKTFEAGGIDAMTIQGFTRVKDWCLGYVLFYAEDFNGEGYHIYHPTVADPYVWAGTTYYTMGKYDVDGHFVPTLVDPQLGVAVILKKLMLLVPDLGVTL